MVLYMRSPLSQAPLLEIVSVLVRHHSTHWYAEAMVVRSVQGMDLF